MAYIPEILQTASFQTLRDRMMALRTDVNRVKYGDGIVIDQRSGQFALEIGFHPTSGPDYSGHGWIVVDYYRPSDRHSLGHLVDLHLRRLGSGLQIDKIEGWGEKNGLYYLKYEVQSDGSAVLIEEKSPISISSSFLYRPEIYVSRDLFPPKIDVAATFSRYWNLQHPSGRPLTDRDIYERPVIPLQ